MTLSNDVGYFLIHRNRIRMPEHLTFAYHIQLFYDNLQNTGIVLQVVIKPEECTANFFCQDWFECTLVSAIVMGSAGDVLLTFIVPYHTGRSAFPASHLAYQSQLSRLCLPQLKLFLNSHLRRFKCG